MTDVLNLFSGIHNEIMPIASIWLDKPLWVIFDERPSRTARITKGHKVRVEDGQLLDVTRNDNATHEVLETKGTVSSSILVLVLKDLSSGKLLTLNIN